MTSGWVPLSQRVHDLWVGSAVACGARPSRTRCGGPEGRVREEYELADGKLESYHVQHHGRRLPVGRRAPVRTTPLVKRVRRFHRPGGRRYFSFAGWKLHRL